MAQQPSPAPASTDCPAPHAPHWLLWSLFLASSWAWCIGMYLPALLRDTYGSAALWAFGIPNVLGVMLFGRLFFSAARSHRFSTAHRPWQLLFSAVTVAFHLWFVTWIWTGELDVDPVRAAMTSVPLLIGALTFVTFSDRIFVSLGAAAFLTSMGLLLWYAFQPEPETLRTPIWTPRESWQLACLTPVLILGFLSCPAYDRSFHRAAAALDSPARTSRAFIGFGLLFIPIILFTALYAVRGFTLAVMAHIVLQSWFTVAVHLRELREGLHDRPGAFPGIVILLAASAGLAFIPIMDYRYWFVFYGLLFPGHLAWMAIADRSALSRSARMGIFAGYCIIAPICGYAGFILDFEWALLIPALMALVGIALGLNPSAHPAGDA